LFKRYAEDKADSETFQEYCLRHSNEELAHYLLGPAAQVATQHHQVSVDSPPATSAGD